MSRTTLALPLAATMSDDGNDMLPQLCGDSSSDDEKPKRGGSDSDEPSSSLSLTRPAGKQRRLRSPQVDATPRSLAGEFSAVDAPKECPPAPQTAATPVAVLPALMPPASTKGAVEETDSPSASGEPPAEPAPSQTAPEESDADDVCMPGLTNLSSGDDSDDESTEHEKAQRKAQRQAQRKAKEAAAAAPQGASKETVPKEPMDEQRSFSHAAMLKDQEMKQHMTNLKQKRVRIDGLVNQVHLNGQHGTVTSFRIDFPGGGQVHMEQWAEETAAPSIEEIATATGKATSIPLNLETLKNFQLKCIVQLETPSPSGDAVQVWLDPNKLTLAPNGAASSSAPSPMAGQKRANSPPAGGSSGSATNDASKQRTTPGGDPLASIASLLQNGGSKEALVEAMQAGGPELLAAIQAAGATVKVTSDPKASGEKFCEKIASELRTMAIAGSCSVGAADKMWKRLEEIKDEAGLFGGVPDPALLAAAERNVQQLQLQANAKADAKANAKAKQEQADAKAEKAKAAKEQATKEAAKEAAERERLKLERQLREAASLTSLADEQVGVWVRWLRDVREEAKKPGADETGRVPDASLLEAAERGVLQLQLQAAQQRAIRAERTKAEAAAATAELRKERDEALKREKEQARQLKALQTDDRKSRRAELQKKEKQLVELSSARDELRQQAEQLRAAKEQAEETLSLVLEGSAGAQLERGKVEAARADAERARKYECPICMDEYVTHILYPCAHPFCAGCVDKLRAQQSPGGRGAACPTCNQRPEKALQIYLG